MRLLITENFENTRDIKQIKRELRWYCSIHIIYLLVTVYATTINNINYNTYSKCKYPITFK